MTTMKIPSSSQTPLAASGAKSAITNGTARVLKAAQMAQQPSAEGLTDVASKANPALRKAFDSFVGQTFYGQMLETMEKTASKPAYMYGGRTEEVFRGRLNQVMAEKLSDASADKFTGPMFELFSLQRR
jgi:hypothetical protein